MRSRFWKFHSILGRRFRFLAGELPQLTMCANEKSLKHMYCNKKSKFRPLDPCPPQAFVSSNSFCTLNELGWDRRDRRDTELKVKHESKSCAGVGRGKEGGRERKRVGVPKKCRHEIQNSRRWGNSGSKVYLPHNFQYKYPKLLCIKPPQKFFAPCFNVRLRDITSCVVTNYTNTLPS